MINWTYFTKNKRPDKISECVVKAFESVAADIDSTTHKYISDEVLAIVRPKLEGTGFVVEQSKRKKDKVAVPVLFGQNGKIEKSFEADAYMEDAHYVVEVEAGRAVANYQFLKDFFEASTMSDVDKLCIAVRNVYSTGSMTSNDFKKVCTFFEAMYASGRLGIPLSGILIVGY